MGDGPLGYPVYILYWDVTEYPYKLVNLMGFNQLGKTLAEWIRLSLMDTPLGVPGGLIQSQKRTLGVVTLEQPIGSVWTLK